MLHYNSYWNKGRTWKLVASVLRNDRDVCCERKLLTLVFEMAYWGAPHEYQDYFVEKLDNARLVSDTFLNDWYFGTNFLGARTEENWDFDF